VIAAFDLDGTLLKKNGSFVFFRFLCERGIFSKLDLFYCSCIYLRHLYGGLSLWQLHHLIFRRLFYGKSVEMLTPYLNEFLDERLEKLWYPPAIERLEEMRNKGCESMVLSNSPHFLVIPIAKKLGIEKVYASIYKSDLSGRLSGIGSMMDGSKKAAILASLSSQKIIAFSDSHLDLSFLQAADVAVAVNPKSSLRKIAHRQGWEIL
jgi:HAD superfamily phosphoserine phosphatase-like hydrolase